MNAGNVEALMRRAESGDADAQYDLAQHFENGQGCPRDFAAALRWYEAALRNRCAAGELVAERIARYHRDGIGTPQDWSRALEMFELAARAYGYAYYDVAWAYYWGLGTPKDVARAFEWHEKMWRRYPHADAAAALAAHFANGAGVARDPAECLRWLRRAGGTDHRLLLGHALLHGLCEPPDPAQAATVFESIRSRLPDGGPPVDELAASHWAMWLAAWNDDPEAQFGMAQTTMRLYGSGVPAGPRRMRWLRKAADSGHAGAQHALGECFYYKGTSAIFAREVGLEWMRCAARQGHADAIRDVEAAKPAT